MLLLLPPPVDEPLAMGAAVLAVAVAVVEAPGRVAACWATSAELSRGLRVEVPAI